MSGEEIVFADILNKTESGALQWSITSPNTYSHLIFQSPHVYRTFKAHYTRGSVDHYDLLLVEKKFEDPDWDFAVEKYKVELIFIQNGNLIATLDEYTIDFSQIVSLARLIEAKSSQARKLFGSL